MERVLPILFNTDMVRAILDGRKTVTRRAVKYKYSNTEMKMRTDKYGTRLIEIQKDIEGETHGKNPDGSTWHKLLPYIEKNPPYRKGDILYVRETFQKFPNYRVGKYPTQKDCNKEPESWEYVYKADTFNSDEKWTPSIHMPKEAARIWLKVTDVRVERLQEIRNFMEEGIALSEVCGECNRDETPIGCDNEIDLFADLWESTLKKKDLAFYGWEANPWVWVIEFERCEKPES